MTKIVVDTEALQRMVDWLSMTAEDISGTGKSLLRATSDARSYNGQYAPWVQSLAGEADRDIRASARELNQIGQQLNRVAKAFQDADHAMTAGDSAWALIMRQMVERGEIPIGDWFEWRERIVRPPWITPEEWRLLTPEDRRNLVLEAREAYGAQNARIARMRTPPWEKDLGWLWNIAGLHPLLFESEHFPDMEIDGIREYMKQLRLEYEQHWADFLANQAVYKFGVGDDLTEAFLIYMFGLEGAAEYGVTLEYSEDGELFGGVSSIEQRLLENPQPNIEDYLLPDARHVQDIHVDGILQFDGLGYGDWQGVHYNLCGEIVIAVTIGADPIEALIQFDSIYIEQHGVVLTDGSAILEDHSMGTDAGDLNALLSEYGWQGERVGNAGDPYPWRDHRGWEPKLDQVAHHFNNGRAVIALVSLDTNSNFIEPVDGQADATHWVSILQVLETRGGDGVVRVYNPYQNREEWYPFDTLVDAWTPGPNYRAVVATPPEEMAWLPSP